LEDDECVDLRGPLAAVATDRTGDTAAEESPGYERQALKQVIADQGYERQALKQVIADQGYERQALKQTIADHGYERQALKQTIADQERQIVHLQGFWSAVQNSAGWRVLEQWRRWRGLVLPVGTRRRRYYDVVLGSLRRTRTP
jgi:septal ring factor EnvC (AmiA/AmiB activator)